jgi:hypothetical protein
MRAIARVLKKPISGLGVLFFASGIFVRFL